MSEPTPEPTPTPLVPAPTPTPEPPAPEAKRVEELPDWAQKLIRETRDEAAKNRQGKTSAEQAQQETLAKIAQALGLQQEDTPPDPAELARTLGEREQRVSALEADTKAKDVELAAWRTASRLGADTTALLDSRSFLTSVAKLDPSGNSFDADLEAAVKKAMESNPSLRAPLAAPAGQAGIGVAGGGDSLNGLSASEILRRGYGN